MSFVHVNSLFYKGKGFLDLLTYIGATVCFSIFLFSIGYIQGKKLEQKEVDTWRRTLIKSILVYLPYLLLGILSWIVFGNLLSGKILFDIAILSILPEYVEFLSAFIFFYLFAKLAYPFLSKFLEKPEILILLGVFSYLSGVLLHKLDSSNPVFTWLQTHLAGNGATPVFPLLHYMPIYLSGIILSKYGNKLVYSWVFSLSLLLIILIKAFNFTLWYRWPPSVAFLLFGLLFISFILFFVEYIERFKCLRFLKLFGQKPLHSLFYLTFFTFLLRLIIIGDTTVVVTWLLNLGIFLFAYISILMSK